MVFAESLEYLVEEAMAICLGLEGCRAPGRGLARSSCAFVPRTAAAISPPQANYSYSLRGDWEFLTLRGACLSSSLRRSRRAQWWTASASAACTFGARKTAWRTQDACKEKGRERGADFDYRCLPPLPGPPPLPPLPRPPPPSPPLPLGMADAAWPGEAARGGARKLLGST